MNNEENTPWKCPDHDQEEFFCFKEGEFTIHSKRWSALDDATYFTPVVQPTLDKWGTYKDEPGQWEEPKSKDDRRRQFPRQEELMGFSGPTQQELLKQIHEEYLRDPTIKQIQGIIQNVISMMTPRMVNGKLIYGTEEERDLLEYWKNKTDDYINANYPMLIRERDTEEIKPQQPWMKHEQLKRHEVAMNEAEKELVAEYFSGRAQNDQQVYDDLIKSTKYYGSFLLEQNANVINEIQKYNDTMLRLHTRFQVLVDEAPKWNKSMHKNKNLVNRLKLLMRIKPTFRKEPWFRQP